MKVHLHPERALWDEIVRRPVLDWQGMQPVIEPVLAAVRAQGDQALRALTEKYDGVRLASLEVSAAELDAAMQAVPAGLQEAIDLAAGTITRFHEAQRRPVEKIETRPGVFCWRAPLPIEKVGLYIPGGTAPLFSTLLMLGIPAVLAGCAEIILCTPPGRQGGIHPAILYTAQKIGLRRIFKAGGAQAIAAMAYGTESIPRVFKIFGPGNQFVTAAKQRVSLEGTAIDMPAGPSEVAVVADADADPAFVAADLLSQAEHGADSQVLLATVSETLLQQVLEETAAQLARLPRQELAARALEHSQAVLLDTLDEVMALVNLYAPEHLILQSARAHELAGQVKNAGSVFIGAFTPESAGDYASGTNHTLPTGAHARAWSGVSLESFMKQVTFQEITPAGLEEIGPAIETMAAAEGLEAHRHAVVLRRAKEGSAAR
ncbi:MAG TPA: histidinol dehydrogenase [bacterium]|nr:histidinol dehydrogenase [bacterium]